MQIKVNSKYIKGASCFDVMQLFLEESTGSGGWVTVQPAMVATVWIWLGVSHLWTYIEHQGSSPHALTLLEGVGECQRGPGHFWECQAHLGYSPASGPTLKKPSTTLVRMVG